MEKISALKLTVAIEEHEGDFLSFLFNEYLPFNGAFSLTNDFAAADKVNEMAKSDPDSFARCVGAFLAYCGRKKAVEEDLTIHEENIRTLLAEMKKEAEGNVPE